MSDQNCPELPGGSEEKLSNLSDAAADKAMEVVVKPLGWSLDGLSVQNGSAAEAIQTADRYLDLIDKRRKLRVQQCPFSISQVVRG